MMGFVAFVGNPTQPNSTQPNLTQLPCICSSVHVEIRSFDLVHGLLFYDQDREHHEMVTL
jgi:hypothetical protein